MPKKKKKRKDGPAKAGANCGHAEYVCKLRVAVEADRALPRKQRLGLAFEPGVCPPIVQSVSEGTPAAECGLIEPGMVLESLSASAGQSVSLKELSYDAALDALRKTGLPVCLNIEIHGTRRMLHLQHLGKIGLGFEAGRTPLRLAGLDKHGKAAEAAAREWTTKLHPGMYLTEIAMGGKRHQTNGMKYKDALQLLKSHKRPLTLVFLDPHISAASVPSIQEEVERETVGTPGEATLSPTPTATPARAAPSGRGTAEGAALISKEDKRRARDVESLVHMEVLNGVLSKVEMRLEDEALGLELHGRTGAGVFIRDVQAASLAARYKLSGGLQLIAVQGESVEGREYDDALGLLRAAVRAARGGDAGAAVPLSLTWRRPSEVAMVVYASKTQAPSVGLHLGDMAIPCAGYCVEILGFRDGTPAEAVPALRRGMALTQVGNRDVGHLSFAEVTRAIKDSDRPLCLTFMDASEVILGNTVAVDPNAIHSLNHKENIRRVAKETEKEEREDEKERARRKRAREKQKLATEKLAKQGIVAVGGVRTFESDGRGGDNVDLNEPLTPRAAARSNVDLNEPDWKRELRLKKEVRAAAVTVPVKQSAMQDAVAGDADSDSEEEV